MLEVVEQLEEVPKTVSQNGPDPVLPDQIDVKIRGVSWLVPEKYGPHGGLLLFLIQKKPAFVPNSEAFNSVEVSLL